MKKKGSICEFTEERDSDLLKCFRRRLAQVHLINLDRIFAEVADMPARRFYVSEFRAAVVIRHHLRHGEWNVKGKRRREMFAEIERRVLAILQKYPDTRFDDALCEVINSPAPCFYLTARSCRTLLYNYIGGKRQAPSKSDE